MDAAYSSRPIDVVIFEYLSGGGAEEGTFDGGLAREGLCMSRTLFSHFSRIPGLSVTLVLLEGLNTDEAVGSFGSIVTVRPGEGVSRFLDLCRRSRFAVLVAPETDGLSVALAEETAKTGVHMLGPDPEALQLASNKALLMSLMAKNGVPVPAWCVARETRAGIAASESIGFPVAAKPLYGTGCEGSAVFGDAGEVESYFRLADISRVILLCQPLLEGEPMSLSLVASRSGKVRLFSVNRQNVDLVDEHDWRRFEYRGGTSCYETDSSLPCRKMLEKLAQEVVSLIPGLSGFVGIDFMMTSEGPVLLEVNPRFTTPMGAMGGSVSWNIGEVLLDACVRDELPGELDVPPLRFAKKDEGVHVVAL